MAKLQTFSINTDPLIKELDPVAQQLGPTLHSVQELSPPLRHLFTNLGPLITVSQTGLPAVSDMLTGATPMLGSLGTFLEQLNPILGWLSLHQQLISDFISQRRAPASPRPRPSFSGGGIGHYLRQFSPDRPRDAVVRAPTATRTTAATPTRRRCGWPTRANSAEGQLPVVGLQEHRRRRATARSRPAARPRRRPARPRRAGSRRRCRARGPGQIPHILAAQYPDK